MDFSMLRIGSGGTASSLNTEIAEVAEKNGVLEFLQ
jgi:hypothetical protein